MPNPYEQLKINHLASKGWEEVELDQRCTKCGELIHDGLYNDEQEIVTWKCSKGHIGKMNFKYHE